MSASLRNKLLTGLVILLLVANITTIIFFWMGMRKIHPGAEGRQPSEFLVKKLALNDAQQEQYKAMVKQHREQTKQLREQMRASKDSFFNLLPDANTNDNIKNSVLDRIAFLNRQLDIQTFDHFKEVRKICNAEQQQKFDKIIKDVLRMMSGPPPHGDRPPPPGE